MSRLAQGMAERGHDVLYLCCKASGRPNIEKNSGVQILRMGNTTSLAIYAYQYYIRHLRGKINIAIEEMAGGARIPFLASLYVKEPIVGVWYQKNNAIYMHQFPRPISWLLCMLDDIFTHLHKHNLIIVLSRDRLEDLVEVGFPAAKLRIIPPGFQYHQIQDSLIHQTHSSNYREPVFVFLNKIRRYKCAHHAIKAFKLIADKHSDSKLIIAGKRDDLRYEFWLRKLVRTIGLQNRVVFKINITDDELNELLSNAKALVLPSPVEGFSQVCLWSNALGTPAIVSTGVPSDAVRHMHNGIVVPFGDVKALASAMIRILEDEQLFKSLSTNAKKWAKNFDWNKSLENFISLTLGLRKRSFGDC